MPRQDSFGRKEVPNAEVELTNVDEGMVNIGDTAPRTSQQKASVTESVKDAEEEISNIDEAIKDMEEELRSSSRISKDYSLKVPSSF
mmetsp:Transcript_7030/g.7955  ORF Transcript_7030/g.7955 Transcript_7030/m.7955 type:complete len:87 (+) Transcript_7030:424-684(+)